MGNNGRELLKAKTKKAMPNAECSDGLISQGDHQSAQDMSIVIFILWSDDSNICMMSEAGSDAYSVSIDKMFFFMNQTACHFI